MRSEVPTNQLTLGLRFGVADIRTAIRPDFCRGRFVSLSEFVTIGCSRRFQLPDGIRFTVDFAEPRMERLVSSPNRRSEDHHFRI